MKQHENLLLSVKKKDPRMCFMGHHCYPVHDIDATLRHHHHHIYFTVTRKAQAH